ncbi:carbohydrate kinase family protein [Frateuria aurantia]
MSGSILCFGEALIDFHGQIKEGSDRSFVPFAGGAPANVAVAAAKLGGQACFIGMLSTDMFGDLLVDSLQQAGVDIRYTVRTDQANTALAFVALDPKGERSFTFYRPPAADLLFRETHYQAEAFSGAAVFHVCSNSMTEVEIAAATRSGMQRATDAGALVSFDVNLRPSLWATGEDPRPVIWLALQLADVIKLSAEEFAFLADHGEEAMLERLWQGRSQLLIVTDGAGVIRWFSRDAEGELPSFKVETVDATAAGDAFVGGLLLQLSQQSIGPAELPRLISELPRLHAMIRFASACGGLTASRKGSFVALPSEQEVRGFLDRQD